MIDGDDDCANVVRGRVEPGSSAKWVKRWGKTKEEEGGEK